MSERPRPAHIIFRLIGTFSDGRPEEDIDRVPVHTRTAIILLVVSAVAAFLFGLAANVIPH